MWVRRAIAAGLKPAYASRVASFQCRPVYYGLHDLGAIGPGYRANLTVLEDLKGCRVLRTYKDGELVADDGVCVAVDQSLGRPPMRLRSSINVQWLEPDNFVLPVPPGAEGRSVRIHRDHFRPVDTPMSCGKRQPRWTTRVVRRCATRRCQNRGHRAAFIEREHRHGLGAGLRPQNAGNRSNAWRTSPQPHRRRDNDADMLAGGGAHG